MQRKLQSRWASNSENRNREPEKTQKVKKMLFRKSAFADAKALLFYAFRGKEEA